MWEAEGGWFTGLGLGVELFEQIMDCRSDLDEEAEESDGLEDFDRLENDDLGGAEFMYDPLPQDDVKLLAFWDEDGNTLVESGTGKVSRRIQRAFEHKGQRYESAPKTYTAEFLDGVFHGMYREYYDGDLGVEVPYNHGKRHGIERWWFESGKLMSLEQYENDVQVGMSFKWDWDGRFERVTKHDNGKEKVIACWDEDGKLTMRKGIGYCTDGEDLDIYFDGESVIHDEGYFYSPDYAPAWLKKTEIDIPYRPHAR